MNKNKTQVNKADCAVKPQPKRRHSYAADPQKLQTPPKVVLRRAITYASNEKLCDPEIQAGLQQQKDRHGGSSTSLSDSKESGSKSLVKGKGKAKKYPKEPGIWKEFIDYILSINSDIADFKKKRMVFGSRDPSEDYISTVVQEIAGKDVVWGESFHSKSAPKTGTRQRKNAPPPYAKRPSEVLKATNNLDKGSELKEELVNLKEGVTLVTGSKIEAVSSSAKGDGMKRTEDAVLAANPATKNLKGSSANTISNSRRRSNDVHSQEGSRPSSKTVGERRHTICGNDMKDIFAPKHGHTTKNDAQVEGGTQGEGEMENSKPQSKWTIVRADFEDQHLKRIHASQLEGWDFLAHTMSAMGNQTSTRQLLYMRYLKRPNNWRHGLSPRACNQYQYIFNEADLMKKDAFRWKNLGVKPPSLFDRIQQKYRPKTTPATSLRAGRRMASQSSLDFEEGMNDGPPEQRPVTAM